MAMNRFTRRDIGLWGVGAALAWPLQISAQQPAMPVVGFLNSGASGPLDRQLAAWREGLKESGFVQDKNVSIEFRWGDGHYDRMPRMAADLVHRRVTLIMANTVGARAAKAATSTIPIVFTTGTDPVKLGLVASLNRPGGNLTGVTFFAHQLAAKRLELLREVVPQPALIAFLVNPDNPSAQSDIRDAETAAHSVGQQILILNARTESDFGTAFETIGQRRAAALVILSDAFFTSRRDKLVEHAARARVPVIYDLRQFVAAGGLISYGTNHAAAWRQAGVYTGRILKGEKPSDLPVQQPTRFELVINLKTAKTLGLAIPPTLLARADEVIE
jgi:putative ABC transport system substrate-binding protein